MPHNRILLYQPTTLDYCKELETIDRSECQSWFNELLNVFASFPDMTPTPYKNSQLPGKVIGQKDFESLGHGVSPGYIGAVTQFSKRPSSGRRRKFVGCRFGQSPRVGI